MIQYWIKKTYNESLDDELANKVSDEKKLNEVSLCDNELADEKSIR